MTKPVFIRAQPVETITLPDTRPDWRGVAPAEVTLGRYTDGRWTFSMSVHLADSGEGSPLGHWSDTRSILAFNSREAALNAGMGRVLSFVEGIRDSVSSDTRSRIVAWASQGDLFAFGA